jgi:hypothetical protein
VDPPAGMSTLVAGEGASGDPHHGMLPGFYRVEAAAEQAGRPALVLPTALHAY